MGWSSKLELPSGFHQRISVFTLPTMFFMFDVRTGARWRQRYRRCCLVERRRPWLVDGVRCITPLYTALLTLAGVGEKLGSVQVSIFQMLHGTYIRIWKPNLEWLIFMGRWILWIPRWILWIPRIVVVESFFFHESWLVGPRSLGNLGVTN